MNKQIILLFISAIISVSYSQDSSSYNQVPSLISFFSVDPNLGVLFKYNRVDLTDGTLNETIYARSTGSGQFLGMSGYDGVNWFDYQFKQLGDFQDGGFSDLGQGDTSAAWMSPTLDDKSGLAQFVPHPLGRDDEMNHMFSVGWLEKNNDLLVLGFNSADYNMFFYFNQTQYHISQKYSNSLTSCYDDGQKLLYINYINPTTNERQIITYSPYISNYNSSFEVEEYSFSANTDSATSVNSNVYLFFSKVGNQQTSPLYMVEVSNNTGSHSTINLLSVELSISGYQASSKIILSLDNTFGSNIDGLPFCYTDNNNQYLILLSKPTSSSSYTITTVDLVNNYETTSITTDIADFYNFGIWYQ